MGLFKSKEEKQMEQRILIRRTMSNMNKFIAQLEEQKKKYIESAKQAKQKGATGAYHLAVSGLKSAMAQQKRAEEMLLNFEITSQMRDLTQITSGFLEGMRVISSEMNQITKNTDFIKIQKEFEQGIVGAQMQSEKLDVFLEMSDDAFHNIAADGSKITDDEIEKLIDVQAGDEENNMDKEIAAKLEEVKNAISNT